MLCHSFQFCAWLADLVDESAAVRGIDGEFGGSRDCSCFSRCSLGDGARSHGVVGLVVFADEWGGEHE